MYLTERVGNKKNMKQVDKKLWETDAYIELRLNSVILGVVKKTQMTNPCEQKC